MVGRVGHGIPLEVVGTMIEMADVAWNALEHRRERKDEVSETARLSSENLRLRTLLSENLSILQTLSHTPSISDDCPPDLYKRLVDAVDASSFLAKLESLHQESAVIPNGNYPFSFAEGADLNDVDISVNADHEEPSWWVWVPQEIIPDSLEEISGIDNENYVVISEENVVDGISNFIARCILENPKSKAISPEELQRTVSMALGGLKRRSNLRKVWEAGKVIYALSTWGLFLAGLYRHRAVVKMAARGAHTSAKLIMKAL